MSIEIFKAAGTKAYAAGRLKEAVAQFTDAIKLMEKETLEANKAAADSSSAPFVHPQAAALYSNRSMCFSDIDKYLEALYDAELCIASKPDWWKAHVRKATAMEGLSRYPEAEASLKEALRLDPSNTEVATKLKNISAVVAKQEREKAKPQPKRSGAGAGKAKLPNPMIIGDWHATANAMKSAPEPTLGSRKGQTLSIRPSILDFAPTKDGESSKIKNPPLFFPAAPQWPYNAEQFMNELIAHATDDLGRAPPLHETRILVDIAANAYRNQKQADDAYRAANKITPACEFCGVNLAMPMPPSCECGETYCSRRCAELHWGTHQKICETIRSQSDTLPMFHRMYWEGCGYGELSWVGERVRNYSDKYNALVREKRRREREAASARLAAAVLLGGADHHSNTTTNTSATSSVNGGAPVPTSSTAAAKRKQQKQKAAAEAAAAEGGFAPQLDEEDVEDLDEFSYLMLHERTAVVRMCTDLQALSQKATAEGDAHGQHEAISDLSAALIEMFLKYSYLDKKKDSVQRVQFKIAMLEMLTTVLMQFGLARHVENLDAATARFEDVIKSASAKDAASPEALSKFIEANGPSATTFSNEVLAAMSEAA